MHMFVRIRIINVQTSGFKIKIDTLLFPLRAGADLTAQQIKSKQNHCFIWRFSAQIFATFKRKPKEFLSKNPTRFFRWWFHQDLLVQNTYGDLFISQNQPANCVHNVQFFDNLLWKIHNKRTFFEFKSNRIYKTQKNRWINQWRWEKAQEILMRNNMNYKKWILNDWIFGLFDIK